MMYYVDKKEIVNNNNYYTFQLQELNVSFVDGDRPIFFRGWRQKHSTLFLLKIHKWRLFIT